MLLEMQKENMFPFSSKRIWEKECIKLKMLLLFFNTSEGFEEHSLLFKQVLSIILIKKYRNETPSALADGLLFGVKEALTTGEGTLIYLLEHFLELYSLQVLLSKKMVCLLWTNWKIGERGFTGYGGQESI
jgi:hypothetical protein